MGYVETKVPLGHQVRRNVPREGGAPEEVWSQVLAGPQLQGIGGGSYREWVEENRRPMGWQGSQGRVVLEAEEDWPHRLPTACEKEPGSPWACGHVSWGVSAVNLI